MISIIIPYYKNCNQIERTILSVINQTYSFYELIIINDCSPDWKKALGIIQLFNDKRIKTISHTYNKNGAAARNTGIKNSIGEYIAFLDADDEWLPNHLEDALKVLKENNKDLVYTQATVKSKYKDEIMPIQGIKYSQSISDYLFVDGGLMFTPTLVVKSEVAKQVLFNEQLRRHQDYDFLLRAEAQGLKIGFVPKANVIVHWETNNPKAKGGTWDFSLQFVMKYKKYLTPKAYSRFVFKNSFIPLLEDRKIIKAFKVLSKHIKLLHLN
ncbi:glycosyltransferase family 2 protein, partial [Carboxylicivirga sp. A043]|uniref:glycosyltransferase family 2 protein n=1 Tax=Carboxylicivirga litoralis TaxID=2816963 RepID=UPI0021CB2817